MTKKSGSTTPIPLRGPPGWTGTGTFRDVEARFASGPLSLRGAVHEPRTRQGHPTTSGEWDAFIEEDVERRSRRAIDDALNQ